MGQYIDGNTKTFTAGAALAKHTRVKFSSGKMVAAGDDEKEIGTVVDAVFADGDPVTVRLVTANGTTQMIAAGAIAQGATVHTAADGEINDTQATGAFIVGVALEAATADGDVIEILRNSHGEVAGS